MGIAAKDGRMRKRRCRMQFKTRRARIGDKKHRKIRAQETGTQQVSPNKMEAKLRSWGKLVRHFLSLGHTGQDVHQVADRQEILIGSQWK